MAIKTAAPSGLTITRKSLKFVCAWKIVSADHGAGQEFQWKTNLMKNWKSETVTKKATEKTVALTASNYFPNTSKKLESFSFRVRGKREDTDKATYDWSAWTVKTFSVRVPNRPALTATLDNTLDNKTTFSWATADDDHRPFVRVEYQAMLVRACSETDGSKLSWRSTKPGWQTGTSANTSGSIAITEQMDWLDSYTRWVRFRAVGAGGASDWRYAKHVYAEPNRGVVKTATVESVVGGATTVKMEWAVTATAERPVDQVQVQYLIATPGNNRTAPSGDGVNWTTAFSVADTAGLDVARFSIDGTVGLDQCLWVRVVAIHDRKTSEGRPYLVKSGGLTAPTNLSVSPDTSTYRASISATNASAVPDSKLAVVFRKKGQEDYVCQIITGSAAVTALCAPWEDATKVNFGVYAFQGSYETAYESGVTKYAVTANMKSAMLWSGGTVPAAPTRVKATIASEGEVLVTWAWSWAAANRAEVSWSRNPNAWDSTAGPETYLLNNTNAAKLYIPNLETGVTWYFRVRLAQETEDGITYGPYCDTVEVNLSTKPLTPALTLSADIVAPGKSFTASWSFESTDGTSQGFAEVWLATVSGDTVTPTQRLKTAKTAKSAIIKSTALGSSGATYYLVVRVSSTGGLQSDWSDPVAISVAAPITCAFSATSLTTETIEDDDETTRMETVLTEMPLTATVTGAGAGGITTLSIERAEAYQMDRPDGDIFNGFEGETIFTCSQTGEAQIVVEQNALIGMLDDGARYKLTATVRDGFGQTASAEIPFLVMWSHQAVMPMADVEIDEDNFIAIITPIAPTGTGEGDVCDIYRLSADKPELIVRNGTFGTTYVDPYPAIGEFGGHRIVFKTANGDYITADNQPAWVDLNEDYGDCIRTENAIIDSNGDQIRLFYGLKLGNSWKKDFKETKYLGGAVQGDWNPAVSRTGTIDGVIINIVDSETVRAMRRLAVHPGICHVRTPDGSSFSADVQVSENRENGALASFNLSITRVDPEGLDGLTLEEWEES